MKYEIVKRILSLSIISATLLAVIPISANAEWKKSSDGVNWNYTENGSLAKGWKEIDGKWYYFAPNGSMARNTTIDFKYNVGDDGARITNTMTDNNNSNNTIITTNNVNNGVINNYFGNSINTNTNPNSNYNSNNMNFTINSIPITVPSTWQKIEENGYMINNRTAVVYKPKDLQGYSNEKALNDIGSAIINDKNNSNVKIEYKKYNGYPAIRCEYVNIDSNGKTSKNCLIMIVTNNKLHGFMVCGENNYGFDIDELDLELALSISLKL